MRTLFYAGLILAVVFLIAAIVLFFVLKIPKALGVVTGRTQKRAIEEIRAGGAEARTKLEKRRGSDKRIHVREVEMDTGALHKGGSGSLGQTATQSAAVRDAVNDAAKAAEKEAQMETKQVDLETGSTVGRTKKDRSKAYEQTEVLGFTGSLDDPSIKSGPEEDETDVLGNQGYRQGEEDETDVLSSDSVNERRPGTAQRKADFSPELEEETDVLSSGPRPAAEPDMETDVLHSGTSVPEDDNIVGRYSAEETAVLRSIHVEAQDADSNKKEIRTLYSETIVHTDETL